MTQVIIVSNRLPVSVKKDNNELQFYPSVGGLATGLVSYVKNRHNKWIGWPGIAADDLTEADRQTITAELKKHNCVPVFLTKKQLDDFYTGYSNTILWPLCHNLRVPKAAQRDQWWRSYREVNKLFADAVLDLAESDSTIWVHDYQLLLTPSFLRAEHPGGHIGFFMHIPFPDAKSWTKLPEAKKLLEGVLGADLIGFHTNGYVSNFLDTCLYTGVGNDISDNQIVFHKRTIRATAFPMGIDYAKYAAAGQLRAVKQAVKKYRARYKGYKLIATVDRLDPSKGLIERLEAYQALLEQDPELRGKVILSMVAAPSRTEVVAYRNLKKRLDSLVASINERFGTDSWQPIDYIDGLPFEEVTALFRVADVAFITPLRDGMNLVAKEFIASKSRRDKGVLILSETAGAAQELRDALIVDPKQTSTVVAALERALTMPERELRERLRHMQAHLASHTVQTWSANFMKTLNQPVSGAPRLRAASLDKKANELTTAYHEAQHRLLLLDYDGSLVPFTGDFEDALPSKSLTRLLTKLGSDRANDVVLTSGRSRADLEEWFSDVPINLAAEHGAYTKKPDSNNWQSASNNAKAWKQEVRPILDAYTQETPRAVVEEKSQSLVWHYRQSPPYYAQKYAVLIKRTLRPILKKHGLEIYSGSKILEIRDPKLNKGSAIKPWLSNTYDFILAVGDDYTDEDMFQILPTDAWTVKVGTGRTAARLRAVSPEQVQELLKQLLSRR